jgi:hypothetical protein
MSIASAPAALFDLDRAGLATVGDAAGSIRKPDDSSPTHTVQAVFEVVDLFYRIGPDLPHAPTA